MVNTNMVLSRTTLIVLVVIGLIWFYKRHRTIKRVSPSSKAALSDDPLIGFVSEKDLDITADAILNDLPQEVEEVLPEGLVSNSESLPLNSIDMAELNALLSTDSSLGTLGSSVTRSLGRETMEQVAPIAESQRQKLTLENISKNQIADAKIVDGIRREERLRVLKKEASILEEKKQVLEEKERVVNEDAEFHQKNLVNVKDQVIENLDKQHKDEEFTKKVLNAAQLKQRKEQLEAFTVEKLSIVKSETLVKIEEKKMEHTEAQRVHRAKYIELEKANEKSIDYARTSDERDAIQSKLQADKKEGVEKLKEIVKEQKKEEVELKKESANTVQKARVHIDKQVDAITKATIESQKKEVGELKEKHIDAVKDANVKHEQKVKELEENVKKVKKVLTNESKEVVQKKERVEKLSKKISKTPEKIVHPRTKKTRRVTGESKVNIDGSEEYKLNIPSDLEPGTSDSIELVISKETKHILEQYRKVTEKIKKDKSLKNVTDEEKEIIALAGREFENVKKEYISKRSQKIIRKKGIVGSTFF